MNRASSANRMNPEALGGEVTPSREGRIATFLEGDACHIMDVGMAFPIRVCAICSEEFELKPDKPGFANRCPSCSEEEESLPKTKKSMDADERKTVKEANEERRRVMRDLLYRKDS